MINVVAVSYANYVKFQGEGLRFSAATRTSQLDKISYGFPTDFVRFQHTCRVFLESKPHADAARKLFGVADNVSSERSDLGFWRAQKSNIRDWIRRVV